MRNSIQLNRNYIFKINEALVLTGAFFFEEEIPSFYLEDKGNIKLQRRFGGNINGK